MFGIGRKMNPPGGLPIYEPSRNSFKTKICLIALTIIAAIGALILLKK